MLEKSVFFVEKPEESSGYLLWKNTTMWQRTIKAQLVPFGISHAQFVILAVIRWCFEIKQEPTQVNIARLSSLDKMTISKSLKKLAALGLVSRMEDARDSRAKTVVLSEKGHVLIKKLISLVEEIDRSFFGVLSHEERKQLNRIFVQLSEKHSL